MTPFYDKDGIVLYNADCRDVTGQIPRGIVLITDTPYGVDLGNHEGSKETRAGLLVKSGGYDDTPEYFESVVVPAVCTYLETSVRGMIFGVPPSIWKFPAPNAIGGVFVSAAVGRNKWGWSNLIHCLLYGNAPSLNLGAKPTGIHSNAIAEKNGHPTVKPIEWLMWAVSLGSGENDIVFDPFAGSGTTLLAAKKLGRKAIGCEISEVYCEIIVKRLSQELMR